ncbi:MAG: DnaJ domain-containing protein [Pseudomonadota bacterium]|nr:DnaJ domain-containing protein [Pseudomonadota bacterium]
MYSLIEFVHLSNKSFKKYSKILILILLIGLVLYLVRFFPAVISTIPAIFLILYRWGNILRFIVSIFFKKSSRKSGNYSMTKKEAYQILGLEEGASKEEILANYQKLMKKNHPDLGGSDWITKKLNKAREILLG